MAREVVDGADAELVADGLDAAQPDAGLLEVLLGLGPLVGVERGLLGLLLRGRRVAVVRLVVEDDDVLRVAEDAAGAADHLGRRLAEALVVRVARPGSSWSGRRAWIFSRRMKAWKLVTRTVAAWSRSSCSGVTMSIAR